MAKSRPRIPVCANEHPSDLLLGLPPSLRLLSSLPSPACGCDGASKEVAVNPVSFRVPSSAAALLLDMTRHDIKAVVVTSIFLSLLHPGSLIPGPTFALHFPPPLLTPNPPPPPDHHHPPAPPIHSRFRITLLSHRRNENVAKHSPHHSRLHNSTLNTYCIF